MHPLEGHERKNLLCCQMGFTVPTISQPQTHFCRDLRPALTLDFRRLDCFDSVHLGRDLGLFWEVCSGLPLLLWRVTAWGLGGLHGQQEVWRRGRQREPENLGGGVKGALWAADPDFTSCPASLHSRTLVGLDTNHRLAGNQLLSPCCE